jgi:Ca-activated chloride channel homolog
VNTIGVGSYGPVNYGKDYFGRPNIIEDTFSETSFKEMATITGGKYIWAKNEQEIVTALEKIFFVK